MSRIVRSSKVRHVFCEPAKPQQQFLDLRLSSCTGEQNYIKANRQYVAFAVATGGGALAVLPLSRPGKQNPCLACIDGHVGAVTDFDWDPFQDEVLASGGEDCCIKVWRVPAGGLVENLVHPLCDLREHQKKVTVVRYHPVAEGVLASGSADCLVKIWDASRGECKVTSSANAQLVQDVVWNWDGSLLASSAKDKLLSVIDPRTGAASGQVLAHDGSKSSKLCFLGRSGRLLSVGFTKTSKRQLKIWDLAKLDEPLATYDIDQGSGALMPFFDPDTSLLYLAGKGDGNVRYFEITEDEPHVFPVSDFRAQSTTKGMCLLPKLTCDTTRTEVARFLKLTNDSVEPLSFIIPRKSEQFQEDVYPDAYAGLPALSADEFFSGLNATPRLTSMDPAKRADLAHAHAHAPLPAATPKRTFAELERDLDKCRAYVAQLQQLCQAHHIAVPDGPAFLAERADDLPVSSA
jgi:coronin-1B/1C/6